MNISVMIPAYNEEKNLICLIPELKFILDGIKAEYEIIVIDSKHSSDNSSSLCQDMAVRYKRQNGDGYGDAFRLGISSAESDFFLVVDADNSQDISKIPEMYKELLQGADIVIGSRYVKGGTTADPFVSRLMSKALNLAYRVVLGFKEKDISTDFRFYNTKKLKSIRTTCTNFDILEETLYLLKKEYPDIIIKEVPIDYKKRIEGTSKRKLFTFILDYIKLLSRLFILKHRR